MPNQFGQLASGIVQYEFDYITGIEAETEVSKVSGWLFNNLGELNTLLYTSFGSGWLNQESGWAGATGNYLQQEEKAIFTQIYLRDYYNKQARITLRYFTRSVINPGEFPDYEMTPWTTLKEGDTTIQRDAIKTTATARTQAARNFRYLAEVADAELQALVYKYNYYQAHPRQTAGNDGDSTLYY